MGKVAGMVTPGLDAFVPLLKTFISSGA
jgi:hypothetical protein